MKSESPSQAENTVAFLQEAQRNATPVLIPGAYEMRGSAPAARPSQRMDVRVPNTDAVAASASGRLEHPREGGGGAPSERAGRRYATLSTRLWQSVLHPMQIPDIWRRYPQAA